VEDEDLRHVLDEIRRRGGIGPTSTDAAIDHAQRFVAAIPTSCATAVDLGSGGGLPGLVIAVRRPDVHLHLVERRARRADLLRYAVRALDLEGSVEVHHLDVAVVAAQLAGQADAVTARSFGPPLITLRWACRLLREGGLALISDPPADPDRWPARDLHEIGALDLGATDGIHRFRRT